MQQAVEGFALSPQQERLWLLLQQCPTYRADCALLIEGALDGIALRRAFEAVFLRHEIFRTTFYRLSGMALPVQVINDHPLYSWQQISLDTNLEQQEEVCKLLLEARNFPLSIERGPLVYCSLLTLREQKHIVYVGTSPLHADMHTLSQLLAEVISLYQDDIQIHAEQESEIPQYVQFSEWQNSVLEEAEGRAYWSGKNSVSSALLTLPYERKGEISAHFTPLSVSIAIEAAMHRDIDVLLKRYRCDLPIFLFTCWQTLLWRFVNQDELLCGLGVDGRIYDELNEIAGPIAKYITFVSYPQKRQRFCDFLEATKVAYEERLAQQLYFAPAGSDAVAASLLYSFGFDYYKFTPMITRGGISFTPHQGYVRSEPFKVRLIALEHSADSLTLTLEYHADLYEVQDIQRLAEQLLLLLHDAALRPECMLSELAILSPAEREQVLLSYNQTTAPYPQEMCLHQLFERQAEQTPDALAVLDEGCQITYHTLNASSQKLAQHLQTLAVGPETLIGLYMERSTALIIAILGVLKAGAAYVPLDLSAPLSRLRFIARDAHLKMVLTSQQQQSRLMEWPEQIPVVSLESISAQLTGEQDFSAPASNLSVTNLAYVIYTSGSTGEPKGVMIPHQGVAHYVHWSSQHYEVAAGWGVPVHSPVSFDLTVTALFAPLAVGRTVWLLKEGGELDELVKALQQVGQWSLLKLTPAHLNLLNQLLEPHELAESSRALILGGEALKGESVRPWQRAAPRTRLINEYGPTETVVGCCIYEVAPEEEVGEQIPIGHPIANTRCYVLDEQGQPVPVGITGELYIGGIGLGRGYIGRADLTAERFVPDPYSGVAGARIYRTGDLARYKNQQGVLEYLGRIDRQVKLRGYRIELGEIEVLLVLYKGVEACVVEMYETPTLDQSLVAYVVSDKKATLEPELLRSYLNSQLPAYMVPEDYVILKALPLTTNGKIDRDSLPPPAINNRNTRAMPVDINAVVPRDMLEFKLLQIWEETLQVRPILITDSFFELGGHSILAVSLMALIRKRLGVDLPLATLFEHRTIAELAVVVRQQTYVPETPTLIAIQPGGSRLPFFCMHPAGGTVFCYTHLARHLGPDQPFYGLQIPEFLPEDETYVRLEEMATRYIAEMQAIQPCGPYLLGGWSSGGVMAFEIAQQLRRRNQEVGLLALLDTVIPPAYLRSGDQPEEVLDTSDSAIVKEIISRKSFAVREDIATLTPEEQLRYVLEEGKKAHFIPADTDLEQFRRLRRIHLMNVHSIKSYVPEVYHGQIDMFRALESIKPDVPVQEPGVLPISWTLTGGWESLTTEGMVVHEIPGNHKEMVNEPNVQFIAVALKSRLEQVESRVV